MMLDSYSFSHIGGRDENQDSVGMEKKEDSGIFVVADGLGGHQFGRLASDCAVETLLNGWRQSEDPDSEKFTEWIGAANEAILAVQTEKHCVTKSTVAALVVSGEKAFWAHSGDSRLYYIHNNEIAAYTEDHSVAYKKFKAKEIPRSAIATDEDQSSLLGTLGNETRWEPDAGPVKTLKKGDAFLLCSDGLWEYVLDEEILIDCLKSCSAMEWGSLLLLRVAGRVGSDNDNLSLITVMVK